MTANTIKKLRIIFFGTADFGISTLRQMAANERYEIIAVVTNVDKMGGRHLKIIESPIKLAAKELGLPILQPPNLKDESFIATLKNLCPDIQVVVAFRMMPKSVWSLPPLGTINLHGSLLPQFRGAAPINWAIITGQSSTGVTTFQLKQDIDTGDILLQEKIAILPTDNAGIIFEKLKEIGANLMIKTLNGIIDNTLTAQQQNELISQHTILYNAPKLNNQNCVIKWNDKAEQVYNLIRGLSPYPAAYTIIEGKMIKIYDSVIDEHTPIMASSALMITDYKSYLKIKCADAYLSITELQLEGKKKMSIKDFLNGGYGKIFTTSNQ